MFPAEKPMILNSISREISGRLTVNQGISLTNLFNEGIIDKIAEAKGQGQSICPYLTISNPYYLQPTI